MNKKCGFTLIETSIIILIVGLIIAGVVGGKALLRNVKMMSVVSETGRYVKAVSNFKQKYQSLPGDIFDAWDLWGDVSVLHETCGDDRDINVVSGPPSENSCNGDGDGWIDQNGEGIIVWKHLAFAKMLGATMYDHPASGFFSRVNGEQTDYLIGESLPETALYEDAGWSLSNWRAIGPPEILNSAQSPYGREINFLSLGKNWQAGANVDGPLFEGAMSPRDMAAIDRKIDDAVANTGIVLAVDGKTAGFGDCVTGGNYRADNDGTGCVYIYDLGL